MLIRLNQNDEDRTEIAVSVRHVVLVTPRPDGQADVQVRNALINTSNDYAGVRDAVNEKLKRI